MNEIRINIEQRRIRVNLTGGIVWNAISGKPTTFPPSAHSHTVSNISDFPESIPAAPHTHDDRYYTETETDTALNGIKHRQRLNLITMFKI